MLQPTSFRFSENLFAILICLTLTSSVRAEDWPQWMGPQRDGTYAETGVVDQIPKDGLPIKWRVPLNGGYSGPAVADGRIYVMDFVVTSGKVVNDPQQKSEIDGIERVLCLDEKTGKTIWVHEYPCSYRISYPGGPRCTPTVAGNSVVTLGAQGDLFVLNADDRKVRWHTSFPKDHSAPVPLWGFAGHPLVENDTVYVLVGGKDQAVAAFDLKSGKAKWKVLSSSDAGYCPPVMVDAGGTRQLVIWHPEAVVSLKPSDGSTHWSVPMKPDFGMSIGRPQVRGDKMFVAGIQRSSLMLKLDSKEPEVTELWRGESTNSMYPGNVTPMWGDGVLFGCDHGLGALVAIDAKNGERLWETFEPVRPDETRRARSGSAFITFHKPSGNYFLFGETGNLSLAEMDRAGYRSKGSMHILEPTTTAFGRQVVWSYPAYANRTIYVRNDKELVAVDIAKSERHD